MSINVVAVIVAKSGSENEVGAAMSGLVAPTREESGCRSYSLYASTEAPGTFITVEEWDGPEDLDTHMQTDHIQNALATLGDHLAAAPAIHPLQPVDVQA